MQVAVVLAIVSTSSALQMHNVEIDAAATRTINIVEGDFVHFHWNLSEPLSLAGPYDGLRYDDLSAYPHYAVQTVNMPEAILHQPADMASVVKQYYHPGVFRYISGTHASVEIRIVVLAPLDSCINPTFEPTNTTNSFPANVTHTTHWRPTMQRFASIVIDASNQHDHDSFPLDVKLNRGSRSDDLLTHTSSNYPSIYAFKTLTTEVPDDRRIEVLSPLDRELEVKFCYTCSALTVIKNEESCPHSGYNRALTMALETLPIPSATVIIKANTMITDITIRPGDIVAFDVEAGQYLTPPGLCEKGCIDGEKSYPSESIFIPAASSRQTYYKSFFLPGYYTYTTASHSFKVAVVPETCWNVPSFANGRDGMDIALSNGDGRLTDGEDFHFDTELDYQPGSTYLLKTDLYNITKRGGQSARLSVSFIVPGAVFFSSGFQFHDDYSDRTAIIPFGTATVDLTDKVTLELGARNVDATLSAETAICWTCSLLNIMTGGCDNGATPRSGIPGSSNPPPTTAPTPDMTTSPYEEEPLVYNESCLFMPMTQWACDVCPPPDDERPVFSEACCEAIAFMCHRVDAPVDSCQLGNSACNGAGQISTTYWPGDDNEHDDDNDEERQGYGDGEDDQDDEDDEDEMTCPFASATESPCAVEACRELTGTGISQDCCNAVNLYCASTDDQGCSTDGASYVRSFCNGDVGNVTGVITLSGLPAELMQDFKLMASFAEMSEASGSGSSSGSGSGSQYNGISSYMTDLTRNYLARVLLGAQQRRDGDDTRNQGGPDQDAQRMQAIVIQPVIIGASTIEMRWAVPVNGKTQSDMILTRAKQISPTALVNSIRTGVAQVFGTSLDLSQVSASQQEASKAVYTPTKPQGSGGNEPENSTNKESNGGIIAGAMIGGLLVLMLVLLALILTQRRRNNRTAVGMYKQSDDDDDKTAFSNPTYEGTPEATA